MSDALSTAYLVLDRFYEAVCACGRKPPFKPVIKVATTPGPSHYDHAQQAVVLVPYELLTPTAQASMDRYGAIGTLGLSGRAQYEEIFQNLLIPHELGHWLQMIAHRPLTRWQAEYGANRLMVAFWRAQATAATAPQVEARLANFVVQPATFPPLLPAGLPVSVERYFNEQIVQIEKNPPLYAGFQKHMVRQAMAEEPSPRFCDLLEETWPSSTLAERKEDTKDKSAPNDDHKEMVRLEELGPRICIMGPSNSGKSTLANAIGRANGLVPVHLDQLHHQPHTDWQPRPEPEFIALHDAAIAGPTWVMDGNYSRCLPQRLARATGVILLDVPTHISLYRYLRRTWFERMRYGQLVGGHQRVTWTMIRHIIFTTRQNRRRYAALFADWHLTKIRLATPRQIARFYQREGLRR